MPWVRFDDQFPIHRKVKGLSDAAFRLHADAIFWCARNLTDGFVPTEDVTDLATGRRPHRFIPELVSRGIWHQSGQLCLSSSCPASRDSHADAQGWLIHDYLDYQPAKAKVEVERKAKTERQARWLEKQKQRGKDASLDASTSDRDASRDATQDASRDAPPPRTRPAPKEAGAGAPPQRASPPDRAPGGAVGAARSDNSARTLAIAHCSMCDDRGYVGTIVCDHDPTTPERNARGVALARAALANRRTAP